MTEGPAELDRILDALCTGGVRFIVVGGLAAVLQGAPVVTRAIGIVHARDTDNIWRLKAALDELGAIYRHEDGRRIEARADILAGPGHNLMQTRLGAIDALGTLDGDDYEALLPDTDVVPWGDHELAVLGLARLIEIKRRVARPKDLRMLPELEATLARIGAAKT